MLFSHVENAVADEAAFIMLSTATKNWKAILHFYIDKLDMDFWSARLFKRTPVKIMQVGSGQPLWEETIRLAENCSWSAGPRLAETMREDQFLDWERVFIAVAAGSKGCCDTAACKANSDDIFDILDNHKLFLLH